MAAKVESFGFTMPGSSRQTPGVPDGYRESIVLPLPEGTLFVEGRLMVRPAGVAWLSDVRLVSRIHAPPEEAGAAGVTGAGVAICALCVSDEPSPQGILSRTPGKVPRNRPNASAQTRKKRLLMTWDDGPWDRP